MIDKNAPLPLVYQTEDFICQIIAERYPIGSLIPTQNELADFLGVSRITVRNAIEALKKRGVLDSCRGKGTVVVTLPRPVKQPSELFDFPMIQPTAVQPALCGSLSLETGRFSSPLFPKDTKHLKIERLYFKKAENIRSPLAWEECLWNGKILKEAEKFQAQADRSLYVQLEDQFGISVTRCSESIEPRIADDRRCDFFKFSTLAPLLCIKRMSYVGDLLFEYRETLIRHEDFGIFIYKANK